MLLEEEKKTGIESIRGLNSAAVIPFSLSADCSFRAVTELKAQNATQTCINRESLYILHRYYLLRCNDEEYTESIVIWNP
jgi:hypothetical protein